MARSCEEALNGQSVNPEPEPKAAAETDWGALTAQLHSRQTNTSQGDLETKPIQNMFTIVKHDLSEYLTN